MKKMINLFYLVRKKDTQFDLEEYKGDKQPVGIFGSDLKPFKQYCIDLQPDDVIYTFTDGYADQFGGEKGKKFKYKPLENLFCAIADKDVKEQRDILAKAFDDWKNHHEQVDDVLIMGIKI